MTSNLYTPPQSEVTLDNEEPVKISTFTKKGRLCFLSFHGNTAVLELVALLMFATLIAVNSVISGSKIKIESMESLNVLLTKTMESPTPVLLWGFVIMSLGWFWVSTCQSIKRLHDADHSGWWVLSTFIVIGLILLPVPCDEKSNQFGAWREPRLWEKVAALMFLPITFVWTTLDDFVDVLLDTV